MFSCWVFVSKFVLFIFGFLCFDLDELLKLIKCLNKRGWNNFLLWKWLMNGLMYYGLFVIVLKKFLLDLRVFCCKLKFSFF